MHGVTGGTTSLVVVVVSLCFKNVYKIQYNRRGGHLSICNSTIIVYLSLVMEVVLLLMMYMNE